ncbi:KaiC domain-containing protein [Methanomicrobium antiquum]|uniref:KaiC domain-containing protein n=1 Tax=Methanomicrobium antiquum TaxID=487686 RepID=A0AAF0FPW3_9EURY|nr:KaiC domain-containing protein [Methanomicrobium antiquum]MDD3977424.1 KaiC domain-containing protein [Methanomicrobium sp.]WFN36434.1 KaiC domain-containing protein [Methanomicrobium antiquum]
MIKERILIGIPGLDEMIGGGLIKGSTTAIIGTYGTGKTTFALQFLFEGLINGENCIYISLEESEENIYEKITDRGWDLEKYKDKSLFVIKLDPTDFNLSINSIKNDLPDLIKSVDAKRVVIDPISLFEGLFDDQSTRRREMFRFIEMMSNLDCTLLLTSETEQNNNYSSRYGLVEYLSDTVIVLMYIRPSDLSEVHTALEVVKMRRSNHSREIKPYEIQEDKVNVYSEASVF